jgi:hypothetical protein
VPQTPATPPRGTVLLTPLTENLMDATLLASTLAGRSAEVWRIEHSAVRALELDARLMARIHVLNLRSDSSELQH